jgi:hypothetical protein
LAEIHWYEAHGIRARRPGRARRRLAGHRRERRGLPVFAHPARGLAVGEPGPGATSRGSRMLANVGPTARRNSLPIVDCRCDDSTHEFRATAVSPHITRVRPGRLKILSPCRFEPCPRHFFQGFRTVASPRGTDLERSPALRTAASDGAGAARTSTRRGSSRCRCGVSRPDAVER